MYRGVFNPRVFSFVYNTLQQKKFQKIIIPIILPTGDLGEVKRPRVINTSLLFLLIPID